MRVFVAGASGAIGRPLVPRLLEAGHEVTGMTRSEDGAAEIRAAGARTAVCDVFDEEGVRAAVAEARAEAVVHQMTALPHRLDFRDKNLYDATNRLRGEGTRILLDAALAAGARRFVSQSIAFIYAPEGDRVKAEDAPVIESDSEVFGRAAAITAEMERAVTGSDGLEGVVLRYGFFYGPGTSYGEGGSVTEDVRKRRFPVVGDGGGVFSFVHVDDAAAATVLALGRGAPGIFNVVDDEPAPMREWLPEFARAVGARRPLRAPAWLARLVAGKDAAAFATTLRGASNAKARRELGWEPRWPSWRDGFARAPR